MASVLTKEGGAVTWVQQVGDKYLCCGKDSAGKRFRKESGNWMHIQGINCWQGRKYLLRGGKRYLLATIKN